MKMLSFHRDLFKQQYYWVSFMSRLGKEQGLTDVDKTCLFANTRVEPADR